MKQLMQQNILNTNPMPTENTKLYSVGLIVSAQTGIEHKHTIKNNNNFISLPQIYRKP